MSEGSLRVAVHRLRRQFATVLREVIAETVDAADDVDEELRHLLAVVSRRRAASFRAPGYCDTGGATGAWRVSRSITRAMSPMSAALTF